MTTLPGFGTETPALVALWTTVNLAELLTVVWAFTPTAISAGFMTWCTIPFGFMKLVFKTVLRSWARNDLIFPFNSFYVAKIVVVKDTDTARQNIWNERYKLIGYRTYLLK